MFSKTKAAKTKAVKKLKKKSDLPSNKERKKSELPSTTVDNAKRKSGQTSGNKKVDVYEFDNEDALTSDEKITPFSQAGRKTNSVIRDKQMAQLKYLEPKVVLMRHIVNEYVQKDKSQETSKKEEALGRNGGYANTKKIKQQGKKTKGREKSKQLPEKKIEMKVQKRKTDQKIENVEENTENEAKKRKTEQTVKEAVEYIEKNVTKRETKQKNKEPVESTEKKIVRKRKIEKEKLVEENASEEPEQANMEKNAEATTVEKSTEKSLSGRAVHQKKPCTVKRKERKYPFKKKIKYLKVKFQKKKPTYTAEDVFMAFQRNGKKPHINISLENMPKHLEEEIRRTNGRPAEFKFGFIGLGTFGRNLATKLLFTCHKVYFWDAAEWKRKRYLQELRFNYFVQGASTLFKNSPVKLVKECDVIFLCVTNFRSVEYLLHDHPEFIPAFKDKGVVNLTTMNSYQAQQIRQKVEGAGGKYLSVGLAENVDNYKDKKFHAIISGDEHFVLKSITCLSAVTKRIYFVDKSVKAIDIAKLLDVLPPCYNVTYSSIVPLCRSNNIEPSSILESYDYQYPAASWLMANPDTSARDVVADPSQNLQDINLSLPSKADENAGSSNLLETNAHSFNNYLSPKAVSQRLGSILSQVNGSDCLPMIETLSQMYAACTE